MPTFKKMAIADVPKKSNGSGVWTEALKELKTLKSGEVLYFEFTTKLPTKAEGQSEKELKASTEYTDAVKARNNEKSNFNNAFERQRTNGHITGTLSFSTRDDGFVVTWNPNGVPQRRNNNEAPTPALAEVPKAKQANGAPAGR